ncbi:MAG: TaqI-like C-terminal specificity domain-containing protein, partial [Candidatus Pacebacteria bacterium]|nr:TaqI-like C-terminal specificity domain-containing protein [Candidatus Paceibacterota bacterium]
CDRFKCRIPFLNGGLFEPLGDYDWRNIDIPLPNELFTNAKHIEEGVTGSGVLDVFDRYNFTVNEAEPLEQEVAIDPEMLGKVFENLIEENRRKGLGAFYTPREIVHYMCQQSLVHYLHSSLNEAGVDMSREDVDTFVRLGEQISHYEAVDTSYPVKMPKPIQTHARAIDEKLAAITVCDPAVGSGAFPVGMMTEIVRCRTALTPYFNDPNERNPYHFKRHAIQHCLYGVDVDAGAVEIAKLRLWLSLVVDEENRPQVKPLPNLDFKIVIGNSLLGLPYKSIGLSEIESVKEKYFEETDHNRKALLKSSIDEAIQRCFSTSQKDLGYKVTFDYRVHFSEVFHRAGGFDIVIQNPPYVQIKAIDPSDRRIFENQYKFATGRFNLFYLFIERCGMLLRKDGVAAFIIPDRILLNTQCKDIRQWLLNENDIGELVSFEDQVFETAVVDSILLFFSNAKRKTTSISARRKVAQREIRSAQKTEIPLPYFELSPSSQFDLNYNPMRLTILQKVLPVSVELGTISESKDGIIQGKVEDQLFLLKPIDEDSKPLLFGKNIRKYQIFFEKNWVNYKPQKMMELELKRVNGKRPGLWLRDPKIFERKKILTRQTADEIIAAMDESNHYYYANTLHGTTITDDSYHPYFVLGVLNCKFTTWYYRSNTDEEGKVFAQIKIELLRRVPIPKASSTEQQPIVERVSRILEGDRQNGSSVFSTMEKEIDDLVYELYGLSQEEIDMVERATGRRSVES